MTEKPELNDDALDALFTAARAEAPLPSDALVTRVLADAEALRLGPVQRPATVPAWRMLLTAIGGWRGGAGLALAGFAGLAIGLVAPEALDAVAPGYEIASSGYGLDDLLPGFETVLDEG